MQQKVVFADEKEFCVLSFFCFFVAPFFGEFWKERKNGDGLYSPISTYNTTFLLILLHVQRKDIDMQQREDTVQPNY